jgi:hypothetical protein
MVSGLKEVLCEKFRVEPPACLFHEQIAHAKLNRTSGFVVDVDRTMS